ncbi:uncharacterized protein LOC107883850 [Acyrthosiphon pisum]|uniref:Secreted protein n=1 Tax=Acyrthosiphon pisum TaxID=7029 RepID=A0A8R2H563_ACYPI|nr:uncharacterized protein LOC107883850 [Acyrthosiphon pisum]|eukprot:XP_016660212.1 PREDICTED: uncharacterized protein LOC107883850 [Acyrthosiphon pisum]
MFVCLSIFICLLARDSTTTGPFSIDVIFLETCKVFNVYLFNPCIPVVKKSVHKDVFKQKLIQHEVGIRKRLIQRWMQHKPTCDYVKINRKYMSAVYLSKIYFQQ